MVVAMLPNGSCYTVDRVDEDGTWWLDGDGAQFGEHDDYRSEPLAWLPMEDWHIKLVRASVAFSEAKRNARRVVGDSGRVSDHRPGSAHG